MIHNYLQRDQQKVSLMTTRDGKMSQQKIKDRSLTQVTLDYNYQERGNTSHLKKKKKKRF